jgi:hypothetical protein
VEGGAQRQRVTVKKTEGTVGTSHDGKYVVAIGGETQMFVRPNHKDVDVQTVVDLRRMLTSAGFGSAPR